VRVDVGVGDGAVGIDGGGDGEEVREEDNVSAVS
jgi:hypothetical protein